MIRRGFTLMEVLLAVALVLLLSGAVYGFLWNLLAQRDRIEEAVEEAGTVTAIVERIEADLLGSLAGAGGKPGIAGTTSSLRLLSRGVAVPMEASEASTGDLYGTEIVWDAASGVVRGRRWDASGSEGEAEEIGRGVQRLRLRYFEGRRWVSTFDSDMEGRLPAAIEVAVWFGPVMQVPDEDIAENGESGGRGVARPALRDDGPEDPSRSDGAPRTPDREPDRVRVMVVPDGPTAAWREGP